MRNGPIAAGGGDWAGRCRRDTHVRRVPASDSAASANVREAWDVALDVPAVAGYEAVTAIGAGYNGHGTCSLVVAGVVGDCEVRAKSVRWSDCVPLIGKSEAGQLCT